MFEPLPSLLCRFIISGNTLYQNYDITIIIINFVVIFDVLG